MHWLTNWFIRNPVAANLLMLLILIGGFFTLGNLRVEGFPKISTNTITVSTFQFGAYAQQIDENITRKVEKSLEGVNGIKQIYSTSSEGSSSVTVQKKDGYAMDKLMDDVRTKVGSIYNLPQAAEKPIITLNEFDMPALIVQVYGDTDTQTLQAAGRIVREELLGLQEVTKLQKWGEHTPEISIKTHPSVLEQHGLTIRQVVEKIQQASLQFRSGSLRTRGGIIELRADSQAYFYQDFANIPVIERADGTRLLLKDVATIEDGFEQVDALVRFNGEPAIGMQVVITNDDNIIEVSKKVRALIDELESAMPVGVKLKVWGDWSNYIQERLNLLGENAFMGLILVFILLAIFLDLRLAFWVALGVPISIAGALSLMGLDRFDYSLNDITTFGFIIALGILVDDAVVVGESVYSERKLINDPVRGTEAGVHKVATATIYGVLTTIAAFYPMLLIENPLGKVLAGFSAVVIFALSFSLLESKFILPAHLAAISLDELKSRNVVMQTIKSIQNFFQNGLQNFNNNIYRPALIWSIKHSSAVLIIFISVAVLGLGLMYKGFIRTAFFPSIPGQIITINLEMDAQAPYQLTVKNSDKIEAAAKQLNKQYQQEHQLSLAPIQHILVAIEDPMTMTLYAELTKGSERPNLNSYDIVKDWQAMVGKLEGTTSLTFNASEDMGGGFVVRVFGKNPQHLKHASAELKNALQKISGVSSIRDDLSEGKSQIRLKLKDEARHLGYTTAYLAEQIAYQYGGAEAQRIQRGSNEIKVMVRGDDESRSAVSQLMQLRVQSLKGTWIPLVAVADLERGFSPYEINRRNGRIVNNIRATIDKKIVSPTEVFANLEKSIIEKIEAKYPLIEIAQGGELEEVGELRGGLIKSLVLTCILIYTLLAVPLKSYWQPFVIMSVIPFAFVGAAVGHMIVDIQFSTISFFGMLALAGVVVNDSLVMMTRFNQAREDGMSLDDALVTAGTSRMRAIFLTTVTTVAGLMPLMSETSEQAQYLIPAAVSLAYGEIFATLIMLLLVPVILKLIYRLKEV